MLESGSAARLPPGGPAHGIGRAIRCLGGLLALTVFWPQPAAAFHAITEYRLDNGLQLVVIEDHRAPAVTQTIWYRVGGSDGPPGKSGLAHYVEHLMFKGTERFGPGAFRRAVQDVGGTDNAFTGRDFTAYFQRVAAEHLERMMEHEADRMRGLLLTEEDIETERLVVLEERSTRTDTDPGSLLREQMSAALFLNHPYSVPIIGWRHEVEQLSREDIFAFYDRHYAPNNAILIIAGDVRPDDVRRLAVKHYGPIEAEPGIAARARPQEPPHLAPRRLVFADGRVTNPYIVRRYLAPERDPGDQRAAAALTLLAAALSDDGVNSYLKEKLEIEERTAIYTDAFYSGTSVDPASFGFVVVPADPEAMEEAEAALDRALRQFIADGVDDSQLSRIKSAFRAAQIYEQDSVRGVAQRVGLALTVGLTLEDIEAWPEILQSVTADEIAAAAADLLRPEASVTGWAVSVGSDL